MNNFGLYIWAKPTLPIASPAPTPEATVSINNLWCTGNGANGSPLSGCSSNGDGALASGYNLTDTEVGYDASLGRWVVTTLSYYSPTPTPNPTPTPTSSPTASPTPTPNPTPTPARYAYLAISNSGTATGDPSNWTKWSVHVCGGDSAYPSADQPVLGWSSSYVGVDVLCFDSTGTYLGPDNLIVVPNSSLAPTPAPSLPAPITTPCVANGVARDRNGNFSSLYLVAPVIPGDNTITNAGTGNNLPTCGVVGGNTSPYALEYTATSAGVAGANGALCGSGACAPLAATVQVGQPGTYSADATGDAQQEGCGSGDLTCEIDANDARITSAQIQPAQLNGQTASLLTFGFVTGYQSSDNLSGAQDLWFVQEPGAGGWLGFVLAGNNFWISYPTIALDNDLDLYLGSTWFNANSYPWTVWDMYHGPGLNIFEGQNDIEQSTAEYTGDGETSPERWGDYNTMVYDSNAMGPNGEPVFWSTEEITCSSLFQSSPNINCPSGQTISADESTSWVALEDPLPWFVGSPNPAESECPSGTGYNCSVTISPPPGVQQGDVLLTTLLMAQTSTTLPTLPSGWTLLPASNITNSPQQITSEDNCEVADSSWLAMHVYGTNEPSSYKFTHYDKGGYDSCLGAYYVSEFGAFMAVYRGGGQNTGNCTAYGFTQNSDSSSFSTIAITPPAENELATVFAADFGTETEKYEPGLTFDPPTGSPTLDVETALTPSTFPFLDADVGVPEGSTQQYGPYSISATPCSTCGTKGLWLGWQVAIPEQ